MYAIVQNAPLSANAVRAAVASASSGAIVLFEGVVRDHDEGLPVLRLDYTAHPQAQELLAQCCAEVAQETGLAVAAAHRVGELVIGDVALLAAVSAPHRAEAFAACALLVERIKSTVPIWKRQHRPDGVTEWVGL